MSAADHRVTRRGFSAFPGPALDELKAEPSLHAQVAAADVMVQGGGHLHDPVVLYVQVEVAAHAAVGADRGGDRLPRLVPGTGLPHVVLAGEHQRAGGAYPDAVAAVDAGRVGQADVELGGDAGVEPPARHRDGERVLGVLAAGLHALVAQDAARVVADVAVVVDLDRLGHRVGRVAGRRVVLARPGGVPLPGRVSRGGRPVPAGVGPVLLDPAADLGRGQRHVGGRGQEFQHHPPAGAHPFGAGLHGHAGFGLARAGGHQRPRPLDLHHADPAHVHRGEGLQVAQRRRVDALLPARVQQGGALGHPHRLAVDRDVDQPPRRRQEHLAHSGSLPFAPGPPGAAPIRPSFTADVVALTAVWPSPQMEASRATAAMSSSRASSVLTEPRGAPRTSRPSSSSCRTVPTRQGTHWPQDSSRKNRAILRSSAVRSAVSSRTRTTPDPSVAPMARIPSNVSGASSASGPTNEPAAPPSSTARSGRPPRTPPAASITWRSVTPNSYSYRPGRSTQPDRQNSRVPVEFSVPMAAKAGPPIRRISGTQSSVSTLLMAVGFPNSPDCAGKGGLLRGSARLPSIELHSAVSSPAMYAPAPRLTSTSKAKPSPITSAPRKPRAWACATACRSRSSAAGYSPRM